MVAYFTFVIWSLRFEPIIKMLRGLFIFEIAASADIQYYIIFTRKLISYQNDLNRRERNRIMWWALTEPIPFALSPNDGTMGKKSDRFWLDVYFQYSTEFRFRSQIIMDLEIEIGRKIRGGPGKKSIKWKKKKWIYTCNNYCSIWIIFEMMPRLLLLGLHLNFHLIENVRLQPSFDSRLPAVKSMLYPQIKRYTAHNSMVNNILQSSNCRHDFCCWTWSTYCVSMQVSRSVSCVPYTELSDTPWPTVPVPMMEILWCN